MNRLRKKPVVGFLLLFLLPVVLHAGTGKKPVPDVTDSVNAEYAVLKEQFGKNKIIPAKYEKQIIYALSWFPELVDATIEFRVTNSTGGIISTRPTNTSVLRRSGKRRYIVMIYDSTDGRSLPPFSGAGINGQVGILGHELCHIVYFNSKTGLGLIGLGIGHISQKYMDRFEHKTDSMDIERGLGYQLLAWKSYLDHRFHAMRPDNLPPPENQPIIHRRYMSVAEIRYLMSKSKVYQ